MVADKGTTPMWVGKAQAVPATDQIGGKSTETTVHNQLGHVLSLLHYKGHLHCSLDSQIPRSAFWGAQQGADESRLILSTTL